MCKLEFTNTQKKTVWMLMDTCLPTPPAWCLNTANPGKLQPQSDGWGYGKVIIHIIVILGMSAD